MASHWSPEHVCLPLLCKESANRVGGGQTGVDLVGVGGGGTRVALLGDGGGTWVDLVGVGGGGTRVDLVARCGVVSKMITSDPPEPVGESNEVDNSTTAGMVLFKFASQLEIPLNFRFLGRVTRMTSSRWESSTVIASAKALPCSNIHRVL